MMSTLRITSMLSLALPLLLTLTLATEEGLHKPCEASECDASSMLQVPQKQKEEQGQHPSELSALHKMAAVRDGEHAAQNQEQFPFAMGGQNQNQNQNKNPFDMFNPFAAQNQNQNQNQNKNPFDPMGIFSPKPQNQNQGSNT
ncbi:unnamed protein product, partial [Polarella glacialis]